MVPAFKANDNNDDIAEFDGENLQNTNSVTLEESELFPDQ